MKLVIMCGGSGTRLWPISRTSSPKQFVKLFNEKSLFELTIERNKKLVDGLIIVVNEKQLKLCKEQVPHELLDKTTFIIEPVGRNTAPAITLAALNAPNDDLLIVASDHLIQDEKIYNTCVNKALELSQEGLVTFGLKPKHPETGFGYIQYKNNDVVSFKEKPDLETAKQYLNSGDYLWNSGMFLLNSSLLQDELKKYSPEILNKCSHALKQAKKVENVFYIQQNDMLEIPKDSIDYAIMEKSNIVKVVPSDFSWTDLGSFDALSEIQQKDDKGNSSSQNFYHVNSKNNLVIHKKVVATFDIEDLIIVDTPDALLIGKKGESQKVKELLEKIKLNHPELLD